MSLNIHFEQDRQLIDRLSLAPASQDLSWNRPEDQGKRRATLRDEAGNPLPAWQISWCVRVVRRYLPEVLGPEARMARSRLRCARILLMQSLEHNSIEVFHVPTSLLRDARS